MGGPCPIEQGVVTNIMPSIPHDGVGEGVFHPAQIHHMDPRVGVQCLAPILAATACHPVRMPAAKFAYAVALQARENLHLPPPPYGIGVVGLPPKTRTPPAKQISSRGARPLHVDIPWDVVPILIDPAGPEWGWLWGTIVGRLVRVIVWWRAARSGVFRLVGWVFIPRGGIYGKNTHFSLITLPGRLG